MPFVSKLENFSGVTNTTVASSPKKETHDGSCFYKYASDTHPGQNTICIVFVAVGQALKYSSVMKHGEIYQPNVLVAAHTNKGLAYQSAVN
jgi:hypothetical protein